MRRFTLSAVKSSSEEIKLLVSLIRRNGIGRVPETLAEKLNSLVKKSLDENAGDGERFRERRVFSK
jgi:hypothetical protein